MEIVAVFIIGRQKRKIKVSDLVFKCIYITCITFSTLVIWTSYGAIKPSPIIF